MCSIVCTKNPQISGTQHAQHPLQNRLLRSRHRTKKTILLRLVFKTERQPTQQKQRRREKETTRRPRSLRTAVSWRWRSRTAQRRCSTGRSSNSHFRLFFTSTPEAHVSPLQARDSGVPNHTKILTDNDVSHVHMQDMSLAFEHGYPEALHYKLHDRRGKCHAALRDKQNAINAFKQAELALEQVC